MSLNRFFFLFFLASLAVYFLLTPYVIDQKRLADIPQFEFESFAAYELEDKFLKVMITGKKAKRFDRYYIIEDFALFRELNQTIESVSALHGRYENNLVTLEGEVEYQGANELTLSTQKAKYHMGYETLDIRVPFVMTQKNSTVKGSSLFFNQKNGKIDANNIQAVIELKKSN